MPWTGLIPAFAATEILNVATLNKIANNVNFLGGSQFAVANADVSTASLTPQTLGGPGVATSCITGSRALVILTCYGRNTKAKCSGLMSFAVGGATTIAPSAGAALAVISSTTTASFQCSAIHAVGLSAGTNHFSARYQAGFGGEAHFSRRALIVIPIA